MIDRTDDLGGFLYGLNEVFYVKHLGKVLYMGLCKCHHSRSMDIHLNADPA